MKILFTGKSDFKYNRVKVLIAGLEKMADVELVFMPITKRKNFNVSEFKELQREVDFIYIPPFRHRDVGYIKKLTNKPIVFDPLISKYLTKDDYGHFWKLPFKYLVDWIPFQKADILISDTECHRQYFNRVFKIPLEKIFVLHIGVDTRQFYPLEKTVNHEQKLFTVGFYGSFVPLQGTDKIIGAAHILSQYSDIQFEIIGDGYTYQKALDLAKKWQLKNINFHGDVKYEALNGLINGFDISLGIFGDSKKADYVIPNKIYHYTSIGQCTLTKKTKGIQEIFTDGQNIVLCENTPEAMAQKILELKEQPKLIKSIGENAKNLIRNQYNEVEVAKRFVDILKIWQKKAPSKG